MERSERANITLTEEGKRALERVAKARGWTMSVWIEEMARKEEKKLKPQGKAS